MTISIKHNAGFFSCCSVKLDEIVKYINSKKKLPDHVDSSLQYSWYKMDNQPQDITYDYFEHYDKLPNIDYDTNINITYNCRKHQFVDYSIIEYNNLNPLITKYFSPSQNIKDIITSIECKYCLDYDNTCVLFYRGNDKNSETLICGYNEYIEKANIILKENPKITFLIQSDETGFIELLTATFPKNSVWFKDEIRHMAKCNNTVDKVMRAQNPLFSKQYLAITIIMSRCKYVICGTGNCSQWIMFYRGGNNNVYQNLNNKWITSVVYI
jgi:hypothetical protein